MTSWHESLTKKHQTRKKNKYGAEKIIVGPHTYDSKLEHEMHMTLKLLERSGEIKDIRHHPGAVQLTRFVKYKPDFLIFDIKRNIEIFIESKGFDGERWRVIRNLWREFGPKPLQVWRKSGNRVFMAEEIRGKE